MRTLLLCAGIGLAAPAHADWYHHVMKVDCGAEALRIIDYSAYNEEGEARGRERGAIDVDRLSTWKTVGEKGRELSVPDEPRPHLEVCSIPGVGKYRVVISNTGGGYRAPWPVVDVSEISDARRPKALIRNLELPRVVRKRRELVFSREHPQGRLIDE